MHTIMADYSDIDLRMKHYAWDVDRRGQPGCHDLNLDELDVLQGYEVLLYANSFLNLYVPDHTTDDLQVVEYMLFHFLPVNLRAKSEIATWMARRIRQFNFVKKTLPFTD